MPLSARQIEPELMDNPAIDPAEHRRALRGLARLNRASLVTRTLWRQIESVSRGRPMRVLDIAAGSGDIAVSIARRSARSGRGHSFTASDISETACAAIRERAQRSGVRVDAVALDIIREGIGGEYDVVMCNLFLHHLPDQDIVRVLSAMKDAAARAVLVTDLSRTRVGYVLAYLASRTLTGSRVVRTDALLSVRAALTLPEMSTLAAQSGMSTATITRVWPERLVLRWTRPA